MRESLEEKTMTLAKNVAELISKNLKYRDGTPVECVIADGTIGRVAESAACADKFERSGVGGTITVTSCWCYGSETMDMNPYWPKAVWGFNGTERPGAVYLAAVLAAHAQKGLPAFGIYGHDVQDLEDNSIPEDVAEKILRFARAAVAVAADIDSYLTLVDLQGDTDTLVEELSGGMKRRLALARAIAFAKETGRDLLLLDEPFTGVDAARITSILASLRRLNFRVFLTAHEESILALADRVIALESKG